VPCLYRTGPILGAPRQVKALNWLGENSFPVWVKPRAGRNQVIGLREGALHVSLTAPPVEGQANEALVRFLAQVLAVRPRQVDIVSGQHSRHKIIRISEIAPEELRQRVAAMLEPGAGEGSTKRRRG
jgi:uncharacterized protein (TIGR00251 family)